MDSLISKSSNFILKEDSIDIGLDLCFAEVSLNLEIARCGVFKNVNEDGTLKFKHRYEWNAKSTEHIDWTDRKAIAYDDTVSELYKTLSQDLPLKGLVKNIGNDFFMKSMEKEGFISYFFAPIFVDNHFWGFIGYYFFNDIFQWPYNKVTVLFSIANNIEIRLRQDNDIAKLQETIEKFDYSLANTKQAIWEVDLLTKKVVFSYNWAEMLGYTIDEIGDAFDFWKTKCHPNDIDRVVRDLGSFSEGKLDRYEGVTRILHRNGNYIWVKYSGLLKKNTEGIPIKIIGANFDISELKKKEHQLELSEAKFRFIADNSMDLISQHASDGTFIYVSKSSQEITGYTPAELIGKGPSSYLPKINRNRIHAFYQAVVKNKINGLVTIRFRNKDGEYIWLETSTKVILDNDGDEMGFQASSRDISSRIQVQKKMKAALRQEIKFNKLKSDFVSMASHQFRTPLTVIYSNAELLDLKTAHCESEMAVEFNFITSRILNEVVRMTDLMNNMLIFGKYESNKIKKNIQPIDFDEFIKTLIQTYFDNNRHERKIQVLTKGKNKVFFTDESLMVHILSNLINNAFKYSVGKSDPLLIITYLENEIKIQVVDYGIGIPQKEINNLFTSFFRASNAGTITGSGLGLVVAKEFVHYLKGTIELQTKEFLGTTIKLTFPYE